MSVKQLVDALVRPEIRALNAYHVPPATGMIKLDAMENPFSWPDDVKARWQQALLGAQINRYPDPSAASLCAGLKQAMQVPEQYGVLLGNGSDEIIQLLAMALTGSERGILAPEPGFVMYKMIATFVNMAYTGVPLAEDFDLDLPAMLAAIEREKPALIFLAAPNNPTGNLFSMDNVRAVIEASDALVVLDEAYTAFTAADHLHLLDEYDNVLVMRTLSKVGLAGLRLGMIFGSPLWLSELDKLRLPYNINVLTQVSAEFALENFNLLKDQAAELCLQRARLKAALDGMTGLHCYPSEANFLLVRFPSGQAVSVHQSLKDQGVLVKNLHGSNPALADCLRLTVGSGEENGKMIAALEIALAGLKV